MFEAGVTSVRRLGCLLVLGVTLACGTDQGGPVPAEECAGQPGCPPLAITDVHLIPMTSENPGAVLADRTVLVRDGRIRRIGPADSISLPPATVEVDGGGRYLIPGLADMHVHLEWAGRPSDLLLYLLQGVTTVRHTDGRPRKVRWRDSVAAGNLLGPTIHMAGPIINGEERGRYEVTAVATSPSEARSVRVQLGTGPFGEEATLALGSDGLPTAAVWQIPAGTFRVWPEGGPPPSECAEP